MVLNNQASGGKYWATCLSVRLLARTTHSFAYFVLLSALLMCSAAIIFFLLACSLTHLLNHSIKRNKRIRFFSIRLFWTIVASSLALPGFNLRLCIWRCLASSLWSKIEKDTEEKVVCPMSEGVSEVNKQAECASKASRAEQANEWAVRADEWTDEQVAQYCTAVWIPGYTGP